MRMRKYTLLAGSSFAPDLQHKLESCASLLESLAFREVQADASIFFHAPDAVLLQHLREVYAKRSLVWDGNLDVHDWRVLLSAASRQRLQILLHVSFSIRWCIGIRSVPCHMTQTFVWIIRDVSSTACSHKVVSIECCQACLIQASCEGYKSLWEKVVKDAGTDAVRHAGIVDLSQNAGYVNKIHTFMPTLKGPLAFTACVCESVVHLAPCHANECSEFRLVCPCQPIVQRTLLHDDLDDSLRLCVVPGSSHMCSNVSNHLRCLCWQETHLCTVTVRGGCWFLLNTSQSTVLLPGHDS